MKASIITVLLLLTAAGTALCGDYVRLGVDSVRAGQERVEIPFFVERTCPEPEYIPVVDNGFEFTVTGDVTYEYVRNRPDPEVCAWFVWGLWTTALFTGDPPDTLEVNGAMMPPFDGMPIVEDHPYFTLIISTGYGEGEICIDSTFVDLYMNWEWMNLQCGLGGSPERPLFVDKYGSDENHPICITVYGPPCGDVSRDWSVDVDDVVYLASYIFGGGPEPVYFEDADVDCSGQIDIDDVVYLMDYVFGTGPEPCAGCP